MLTNEVFIIAELSANHNGSLAVAKKTIRAAKRAGANAIKLQTYTPDTITMDLKTEDFRLKHGSIWDGKYLHELYKEAHTPWEWHKELFKEAHASDLLCFSSPFDLTAVDFLEELDCPIYKIASFEITDIPLIRYAASKGKPMIISTGIAGEEDIELALEACKSVENNDITLLKCTSSYPAPIEEANLAMIADFKHRYRVKVGLSDHTLGITAPVVATALGARVIEKHLILDKSIGGPDSSFSLDVDEFTEMVNQVRMAESAIGRIDYSLTEKQLASRTLGRSLYVISDITQGEFFTKLNVKSIRPGYGLHPKYYDEILGKTATRNLRRGEPLQMDMITKFQPVLK